MQAQVSLAPASSSTCEATAIVWSASPSCGTNTSSEAPVHVTPASGADVRSNANASTSTPPDVVTIGGQVIVDDCAGGSSRAFPAPMIRLLMSSVASLYQRRRPVDCRSTPSETENVESSAVHTLT